MLKNSICNYFEKEIGKEVLDNILNKNRTDVLYFDMSLMILNNSNLHKESKKNANMVLI